MQKRWNAGISCIVANERWLNYHIAMKISDINLDKQQNTEDINLNQIKSVSQLSIELKNLIESNYPYVWVRGELGPVKVHTSGHTYFSMKEGTYVINAICWKGTSTASTLKEGAVMECYGRVTSYPDRSSYQIQVREAREVNQRGDIFQQLEEVKQKLLKEGLFETSRKKAIPKYPECIAILTSPTGAVLHDMMHRIKERYPCCKVLFFSVPVQGNTAAPFILRALEKAESIAEVDTIILARGGGSIEDLWVFNDESIVRKVAALKLPIISAIGHETDTTLVDYAADLRAPTPTAAAEFAVPDKLGIKITIETNLRASFSVSSEKLKQVKSFLENFADYKYIYNNAIGNFGQKIDNIINDFTTNINERLAKMRLELGTLESGAVLLEKFEQKINEYNNITHAIMELRFKEAKSLCEQTKMFLDEKEYELKGRVMITNDANNRITSAEELKTMDEFIVKFLDGNVHARTKK